MLLANSLFYFLHSLIIIVDVLSDKSLGLRKIPYIMKNESGKADHRRQSWRRTPKMSGSECGSVELDRSSLTEADDNDYHAHGKQYETGFAEGKPFVHIHFVYLKVKGYLKFAYLQNICWWR